jgi:hypothetical protein
MKRREFIAGLGGAVAGPFAVSAQQGDRVHASACSYRLTKTTRKRSLTSLRSHKRLRTWVGPMAAMCGWTLDGMAVTPIGRGTRA